MTDEVKFTDEQWDKVAQAAEVFADALEVGQRNLKNVLTKNWAGECAEGEGTLDNLRAALNGNGSNSFAGALKSESEYLRSIANQCRASKGDLNAADGYSSDQFLDAP